MLLALGVAVACASPWVVLAVALYFLAFYPSVMREEAAFLGEEVPGEYAAWAAAVPLFWPRPLPGGPRESRFEWARVRFNREWRTAAALPLLAAMLYARSLVPIRCAVESGSVAQQTGSPDEASDQPSRRS